MNDFYIAFELPSYLFMLWVPGLWSFQQMFYGNGIFVDCILYFDNIIIFYLFAMLLSSITFTQHQSLFLGFAICKYIVYIVIKKWYAPIPTIFAMRPPFLMLDNIIFQIWMFVYNVQRLIQHLPWVEPCIPSIQGYQVPCQWQWICALGHDVI